MNYLDMGNGEVLVLIHGLASIKESWKYQFELSKHFRILIPDLRGHGKGVMKSKEIEDISISQFAKDILALLDTLGIEEAHFCGHSMGGIVVQEIYKQQPNRIKSLILSNTFSYAEQWWKIPFSWKAKKLENTPIKEYTLSAAKKCVYNKEDSMVNEVKKMLRINKEAYIKSSLSALKVNYLLMLPFIKVPILIIGSMQDEIVPISMVSLTYSFTNKQKARLMIFNKAGHMPNIEHKITYNKTLLEFLQSIKRVEVTL